MCCCYLIKYNGIRAAIIRILLNSFYRKMKRILFFQDASFCSSLILSYDVARFRIKDFGSSRVNNFVSRKNSSLWWCIADDDLLNHLEEASACSLTRENLRAISGSQLLFNGFFRGFRSISCLNVFADSDEGLFKGVKTRRVQHFLLDFGGIRTPGH